MKAVQHFKTITKHKLLVMKYCFRVGLIRQGLLHDLSKYSWQEFRVGMKYYAGTRSPNAVERDVFGYSTAWMHHKGRNRHHLEYWTDYGGSDMRLVGQPMPTKYMVELCLDRISACRVYHGDAYTDRDPLDYLNRSKDAQLMHPATKRQVVEILTMLAEEGEEKTLKYIRDVVLAHPVALFENRPKEPGNPGIKDEMFLSGEQIKELAAQYETPFYLYSEAQIQQACRRLNDAFAWNPGYRQFFPVKATPTPGILRIMKVMGHGAVCSSATELELCVRTGFSPGDIMFLPNYPRKEDMEKAAEVGCMVTLDGFELIDMFAQYGLLKAPVGLRINPDGVVRFGSSEVKPEEVKFGMSPDKALLAVERLREHGVTEIGLHCYISGNTLETDYYPTVAKLLAELGLELHRKTGVTVSYLNLSGGPGIPYRPGERAFDMASGAQSVKKVLEQILGGTALSNIAVFTEAGRYITGQAGVLVTRVLHIKRDFRNIAGVDASAADLMRPMMYGAYHHISVAGKEGVEERTPWDVVGSVCENTDKFAQQRMLPELHKDDVLLIHDSGAHGHSMGYRYGGRLRCGEYLLKNNGKIEMVRRAETTTDHFDTLIF